MEQREGGFKHIMFTVNDLIQAFDNNLSFAWELLHAEMTLETSVDTDHLKSIIVLYSKAIEKLHLHKMPCVEYFKHKINQLMGQKQVIHCLTEHSSQKKERKSHQLDSIEVPKIPVIKIDPELQVRKQNFELRVAYGVEDTKNVHVKQIIRVQAQKAEKIKEIVWNSVSEEEEKLKMKIERRQKKATAARKLRQSVDWSRSSTEIEMGDNFSVNNDISFISDCQSDL